MENDERENGDGVGLKKKELRQEYRKLIQETEVEKEELLRPGNEGLSEKVSKAQQLFSHVKDTREGVLDSRFMTLAVALGVKKTQQVDTNFVSFDYDTYVAKVNQKVRAALEENMTSVEADRNFWHQYDRLTYKNWKNISPTINPLLGALGGLPDKKRKQSQRTKEDRIEVKQEKPQKLSRDKQQQSEDKEATPEEIEKIFSIIQNLYAHDPSPIDFWELVINPHETDGFGRTIENVFHLAFLDKDGLVRIFFDDRDLPVVEPLVRDINSKKKRKAKDNSQCIVSLTMDDWENLVNAFQLRGKDPMIPVT